MGTLPDFTSASLDVGHGRNRSCHRRADLVVHQRSDRHGPAQGAVGGPACQTGVLDPTGESFTTTWERPDAVSRSAAELTHEAAGLTGSELRQPGGRGGQEFVGHGHQVLEGQGAGDGVGRHGLEDEASVAGESGLDGEFLGRHHATEVLGGGAGRGRVAGPDPVGVDGAHALDDHTVGEVGHLTGVREVDR